jgi:hypothetical protein
MARIRYLKPDFFKDEDLAELPPILRLFFEGLWCHADKAGRLEDRPLRLRADIMPYEKDFDSEAALDTLAHPKIHSPKRKPFIVRYEIDGEKYIQILSWEKHQKPHHTEAESAIPAVPSKKDKSKNGEYKGNGECSYSECSDYEPVKNVQSHVKNTLIFNLQTTEWEGIGDKDLVRWKEAYPACDIKIELARMREWILSNKQKGKKSNYRRFITNWLSRAQDRGGTKGGFAPKGTWLETTKVEDP